MAPNKKRKANPGKATAKTVIFYTCPNKSCLKQYKNEKGLAAHFARSPKCSTGANKLLSNQMRQCQPVNSTTAVFREEEDHSEVSNEGIDVTDFQDSLIESEDEASFIHNQEADTEEAQAFDLPTYDANCYNENLYFQTKLLKILHNANVPHYVYNQIVEWAQEASQSKVSFLDLCKSRKGAVHQLEKWMPPALTSKPIEAVAELPTNSETQNVPVTIFDFKQQLLSLLNDHDLFGNLENLDVNPTNIFGKYQYPNQLLSTVNSGYRYKLAYSTMVQDPSKDFLMPIIFACDETKVSSQGKGSCWPLMFTTSILNQKKRNLPNAWRPLGYVYDTSLLLSSNEEKQLSKNTKYQRLHNILGTILKSYVRCQNDSSLDNILLRFGDKQHVANLKVPCFFIIGDMQGGDKMACSSPHYSHHMQRLCRKCNVKGRDSGDPFVECRKIVSGEVEKLVEQNQEEALKAINQYNVENAWFKVNFGGCAFGIFSAACPVEPLHALENGIIADCLTVLHNRIGSSKLLAELDVLGRRLVSLPRQQQASSGSDKSMPRLLWKDGISKLTDLTAAAKVGIMFTTIVIALQKDGRKLFRKVLGSEDAAVDMIECFQLILCYWSWLKKDTYWERSNYGKMEEATQAIRNMLHQIISLWPREEGQGWNIAKFHEQIHVPDDIFYNGRPQGTHSGPVEHNHIQMVKRPSTRTQKRRTVLDKQLALRLYESSLVNSAQERMESYRLTIPLNQHTGQDGDGISMLASKATMRVEYDGINGRAVRHAGNLTLEDVAMEYIVEDYIKNIWSISPTDPPSSHLLNYFSEYIYNGTTYRSHSNYRGNGPWYDWVMIRWKRTDGVTWSNDEAEKCHVRFGDSVHKCKRYFYCPGQVLAFTNPKPGVFHAIVKCCEFAFEKGSIFSTQWKAATIYLKSTKRRKEYICHIDVEHIVRPCLMIPENYGDPFTQYHEIWNRSLWADEFL